MPVTRLCLGWHIPCVRGAFEFETSNERESPPLYDCDGLPYPEKRKRVSLHTTSLDIIMGVTYLVIHPTQKINGELDLNLNRKYQEDVPT